MSLRGLLSFMLVVMPVAVSAQGSSLSRAAWLAGCWELRAANRVVIEMWMPPLGDLMLGASRTTVGTVTREFEQLRLQVEGERLNYIALPSRQQEATFPSIELSDTTLVFENKSHDFPQRIGYRRQGADSLIAYVEGPSPTGTRRIQYPYRRASCTSL